MSDRIAIVRQGSVSNIVQASKLTHDDLVRASTEVVHKNELEKFI